MAIILSVSLRVVASALVCLLAACGTNAPAVAPLAPPGLRPVPVKFQSIEVRLDRGQVIGGYEFGLTCLLPWNSVTWQHGRKQLERVSFADHFFSVLSPAGYDVTGNPARLFGEAEDHARADLLVAAQIDEITLSLCRHPSLFGGLLRDKGAVGTALIRVHWAVWDVRTQREVLHFTGNGVGAADKELPDVAEVAIEQAFRDAVGRLAAFEGFRKIAFTAAAPPQFLTPSPMIPEAATVPSPPATEDDDHSPDLAAPLAASPSNPGDALVEVGEGRGRGVVVRTDQKSLWVLTFSPLVAGSGPWRVVPPRGSSWLAQPAQREQGPVFTRLRMVEGPPAPAALTVARTLPAAGEDVWLVTPGATPSAAMVAAVEAGRGPVAPRLHLDIPVPPPQGTPLLNRAGAVLALASGTSGEDGLAEFIAVTIQP